MHYLPSVSKRSHYTVINANHRYLINHYRIIEAVHKNRRKLVEILIALGDLEEFPNWDETLPKEAFRKGYTELIKLLIFHGARPKALIKTIGERFFLIKNNVIKKNDLETLSLLSSQSPELGTKLLEVAILQGNSEVTQMLLDRQVPINDEMLYSAVENCDRSLEDRLVVLGAQVNPQMLDKAAKKGDRYLIERLLELGAQVTIHTKAFWGDLAAVINYLETGGEVNLVNKDSKRTLLHEAVVGGNKEMVEFLLVHGANVNAFNDDGTPLHQAATYHNLEIAKILIASAADVNDCRSYGTPLHKAAASGSLEIAALLINNGAEVNNGNRDNDFFPLHKAAAAGQSQMIDFLIAEGAEVNIKTKRGETPLHLTANRDTAERLISRGADINAYSEFCGTPIQNAISKKRFDVAELLLDRGADVKSKNALWSALDSPKVAKLLILNGADVNDYWEFQPYVVARGKITLLHSAVRGGWLAGRGGCLPAIPL